jgi:hypothetical protein
MPISSVDLISLLDKVKKGNADPAAGASPATAAKSSAQAPAAAPSKAAAPAPSAPAPKAAEQVEVTIPAPRTDLIMPEESGNDLETLRAVLQEDEELIEKLLGLLYRVRKLNPHGIAAVSIIEIEKRLGLPREGGTFIYSYLKTKRLIEADDKSRFAITVEGIDYLREVVMARLNQRV